MLISRYYGHRSNHLVDLPRTHLLLQLQHVRELVLGVRPQLLEYGLSLLLLVIALLKGIFEADFLLHPLIVIAHLIVHLLNDVLAVRVRGSLGLMGLQLEKHLLFVLLVDLADLGLGVLDVLLALALTLADLRGKGKPDGPVLVFGKLSFHLQDLCLVHFLNIEAHSDALLKAVSIVVPALYKFYLITKFLEVVHYLGVWVLVVKWGIKFHYNWGTASNSRLYICLDVDN